MGAYSHTPLAKKLGIKPGSILMLLDAPSGFEKTLGPIVRQITIKRTARGQADRIMIFAKSVRDYARRLPTAIRTMKLGKGTSVWICWPKKSSGITSDLTQDIVRQDGLDAGIVDYKIASIEDTWSGLCFAERRK
jgi:hypothetical protein